MRRCGSGLCCGRHRGSLLDSPAARTGDKPDAGAPHLLWRHWARARNVFDIAERRFTQHKPASVLRQGSRPISRRPGRRPTRPLRHMNGHKRSRGPPAPPAPPARPLPRTRAPPPPPPALTGRVWGQHLPKTLPVVLVSLRGRRAASRSGRFAGQREWAGRLGQGELPGGGAVAARSPCCTRPRTRCRPRRIGRRAATRRPARFRSVRAGRCRREPGPRARRAAS